MDADELSDDELKAMAIPVRKLANPKIRKLLTKAGIIWGLDTYSGDFSLFYGKEMLEDIANGREAEFDPQLMVVFAIDARTPELECLYVAVERLKGYCCYNA